ncbi:hypothetical protein COLO4_12003 [Corchorus olitorius]|uniref:Uncharacterized protein n=1 Tax=Corchorus olitorius TaxID=93759 RepID=A0A1R3K2G8_9ROSI|nr:hypothetical protein COLO4_12003 [Corchorus olitorius]
MAYERKINHNLPKLRSTPTKQKLPKRQQQIRRWRLCSKRRRLEESLEKRLGSH